MHLARSNPLRKALESSPRLLLTAVDDYAFIPTTWRAAPGGPRENGAPTSYFATVQLRGPAEVLDGPAEKAALLRRQLEHFQPEADHGPVTPPYGRMLAGLRGLRRHIVRASAKFKFDDHKPTEHRAAVASRLWLRGTGRDHQAREQQLRRPAATERRSPDCDQLGTSLLITHKPA